MKQVQLLSPVTGQLIALSDVQDPVFSQGMMGQGFGVEPDNGQVVAPVSGKITMVAATLHAIGFVTKDGLEVLVHLGIDTVELKDNPPFKIKVQVGDEVQAGDEIGRMDLAAIKAAGKQKTVILAVTNSADKVDAITAKIGIVKAGAVGADVDLKGAAAAAKQPVAASGNKYDQLATQIIENIINVAVWLFVANKTWFTLHPLSAMICLLGLT